MILVEVFTNHISAENAYFTNHVRWAEHKILGFKPVNRYQIIWQSLIHDFHHHPFFFQAKVNIIPYGGEHKKLQGRYS